MVLALTLSGQRPAVAQAYSGRLMEAVEITLRQEALIASARQQIAASQGQLLSARAPFDRVWNAGVTRQRSNVPLPGSGGNSMAINQQSYFVGASQLLESGVVVNPKISIDRIQDIGANSTGPSTSNAALNILVPLRKGAGAEVTTAPVTAASLTLEASRSSYRHTQASSVVQTATAYWDLVAARQSLDLATQAQSRAELLLANARKLAGADEIPKADLLKYDVRRIAQQADRLRAVVQLGQAQQALSQAMNMPLEALQAAADTLDNFPATSNARLGLLEDAAAVARLMAGSADRRFDIRAAEQQLRAANTLADAARRNSSSQLDLGLSIGYSGLAEGRGGVSSLRALGNPARGLNATVSLNYTLPDGAFEQRGLSQQRDAAAAQLQTSLEALRLRAKVNAATQLSALVLAIAQLDRVDAQRRLQATIYDNEKRSYQAGLSTLLDLFTTESQLTATQLQWVQVQRDFAQALALFRFQTATLLLPAPDEEQSSTNIQLLPNSLTTLPLPGIYP